VEINLIIKVKSIYSQCVT